MIDKEVWNLILKSNLDLKSLEKISEEYKIPMSFIVGRLAKMNKISYTSKLYRQNYQK